MFNFKKITFKLGNKEKITLTPTICYICSDMYRPPLLLLTIREVPVIMYEITHKSIKGVLKSTIPYYISDGHTNNLRANIPFPMMSFNKPDSFGITPITQDVDKRDGLQIKYNAISNLNTVKLNVEIDTLFNNNDDLHFLKSYSKSESEGSTTIIMRIKNFLDFVIALLSSSIELYCNDNISNFRPITHIQTLGKYNMYRSDGIIRCPSKINDKEYIQDESGWRQNKINEEDYIRLRELSDKYNECILTVLKKYINIIKRDPLITVDDIDIPSKNITMVEFNRILNICENESYPINVLNYQYISSLLFKYFKNIQNNMYHLMGDEKYFENPLEQVKYQWSAYCSKKEFADRKANDLKKEKEKEKEEPKIKRPREIEEDTVSNKKMHEKYLKYKIKYLNLKKLK